MIQLTLKQSDFEALHVAADGKGVTAKVSKAALSQLLMDHAALIHECRYVTKDAQ